MQTMPEAIKVKDKGFQTKEAEPKIIEEPKKKKLKEKQNQTHADLAIVNSPKPPVAPKKPKMKEKTNQTKPLPEPEVKVVE